jgi:hypothetical protein
MRLTFEVLLAVFALYAAFYIVNLNEQYADMVASVHWCNIQFDGSTADKPCTMAENDTAKVSFK